LKTKNDQFSELIDVPVLLATADIVTGSPQQLTDYILDMNGVFGDKIPYHKIYYT
jgi:hypothetical protein